LTSDIPIRYLEPVSFLQNILEQKLAYRKANKDNIVSSTIEITAYDGDYEYRAMITGPEFWQVQDWLDDQEFPHATFGFRDGRTAVCFNGAEVCMLIKMTWSI
jgi:hypothetical protein